MRDSSLLTDNLRKLARYFYRTINVTINLEGLELVLVATVSYIIGLG